MTSLVVTRGVSEIIVEEDFIELLQKNRPLRLKMGFDPSSPDIHLGHVVGLRKLRQLQDMGHQVILIVGDWTARIGDPSGQSVTRPILSSEEVKANAETYMQQFFKVVDKSRTQVVWQSEWFGDFNLSDVLKLTSRFTLAQFMAREDFSKRYKAGRPISISELLYPLLQAYDSIAIDSDVEVGGTDQKFNLLVGRELQVSMGKTPQQCLLVPILVGTDSVHKMSKSLDNCIGVDEPPNDMYGKIMSIPDQMILTYFDLLTDIDEKEILSMRTALKAEDVNPMVFKKKLAELIVSEFHDRESGEKAREWFQHVFQERDVPIDMPEITFYYEGEKCIFHNGSESVDVKMINGGVPATDFLAMTNLVASKAEAKRLLSQGSVQIDGARVGENILMIANGSVIKIGKRRFVKLVLSSSNG